MTHVSIIGTGSMGQAIAQVFTRGGATVDLVARGDSTPLTGDVVVLALPYAAVADVLTQRADELSGKVVVDITNPLDFTTFDSLDVPADSSATATIAAALPSSRVVKAFNTTFATTLTSGVVGQATTTVLLAGDDVDAKALVSVLVTAAGLAAIDAGSLRRARELETLGFLQITLAASEKVSWSGGFAVIA